VYSIARFSGEGRDICDVDKNYTFSAARSETTCSVLKGSEIKHYLAI
jgi:hypothetical protein